MKIYTAATFSEQKRIRAMKEVLVQMGHSITASWLEETIRPEGMDELEFERKMAMKDLQEVSMADCVITDMLNPSRTAGKMIETGFAIARHKLLYTVGEKPLHSIFLHLADKHFASWDELFDFFKIRQPSIKTAVDQLDAKYLLDPNFSTTLNKIVKKAK